MGKITLIDPDVLEPHNLENQVYEQRDLHKPKVQALKERVLAIDPSITATAFIGQMQGYRGELGDTLFGCLDNVAARHYVNYLGVANRLPVIDGGIERFKGGVLTVQPGLTACLDCHPILPASERKASCSSDPIPSTYVTAAIVANFQVAQFIRLVHNQPLKSYVSIDVANGRVWANNLERNAECIICSCLEAEA